MTSPELYICKSSNLSNNLEGKQLTVLSIVFIKVIIVHPVTKANNICVCIQQFMRNEGQRRVQK